MFLKTITFVVASLAAVTDAVPNFNRGESTHRVESSSPLFDGTASSSFHDQVPLQPINQDQGQRPGLSLSNNDSMDEAPDLDTTDYMQDDDVVFSKCLPVSYLLPTDEMKPGLTLSLLDEETGEVIEYVQFVIEKLSDGVDDPAEFPCVEDDTEHLDQDDDDPGDL